MTESTCAKCKGSGEIVGKDSTGFFTLIEPCECRKQITRSE
jgi:DnaJ-class molecular chaperone